MLGVLLSESRATATVSSWSWVLGHGTWWGGEGRGKIVIDEQPSFLLHFLLRYSCLPRVARSFSLLRHLFFVFFDCLISLSNLV